MSLRHLTHWTEYVGYLSMLIVLYLMLTLNLIMFTIAYTNGDQPGVSHAITFTLVACVGLVASWMRRRAG